MEVKTAYLPPYEFDQLAQANMTLMEFDKSVHAGTDGQLMHQYRQPILRKLARNGVTTYSELVSQSKLAAEKKSDLSTTLRVMVQAETLYYLNMRNIADAIWTTLSDEEKEEVKKTGDYIYRIEDDGS